MWINLLWWYWLLMKMLHNNSQWCITLKRSYTCHHLIEDDTEGIEIATWVIMLTQSLFWCHILWCSDNTSSYCAPCYSILASNPKIGENRLAHWPCSRYALIK